MSIADIPDEYRRVDKAAAREGKGNGSSRRRKFMMRYKWAAAYASYTLLAFPIHLFLFILVFTFFVSGVPMLIIWVGFPILYAAIMTARAGAIIQRGVSRAFEGEKALPSIVALFDKDKAYEGFSYPIPKDLDWFRKLLYPLRDPQSWLDVVWALTSFVLSLVNWCVTLVWVVAGPAFVTSPISIPLSRSFSGISYGETAKGIGDLLHIPHPMLFDMTLFFLVGLFMVLTAPYVLKFLAKIQLFYADVLLSRRARDREDIERLTRSRAAGRRAESAALRKLERDLHDGPQQRLVRLNMDLARARRQAGSDPVKAQAILDEAMVQTQDTLAELRQLSRGIAPPVLVDRGLVAAVREAAARSVVPVSVHAGIPSVPDHVASAAYYVVAESLVNVNKHASASSVVVTVDVSDGVLRVSVVDDGVGGADVSKGHGLVGLEERLSSVDGTLEIDSPIGGPTTIQAVIPCVS